ncbi:MAG TPA: SRPBCC domain-containing protein [Candidatus Polarisedimenticolaceae bacterium]|nr:SRPBCC domain-containing protein [Candidatus Polarisedimenticolaceae bacterium]
MADIFHDFPINAPAADVYRAVSTPAGLDAWWTVQSSGQAERGAEFELGFGVGFDWRAKVSRAIAPSEFELEMTRADADWIGTRVGFRLTDQAGTTQVSFYHVGWPEANAHWRTSCYCWAMYLRLLRRYVEHGERVPYEARLDV